jgi:hypothetical protein
VKAFRASWFSVFDSPIAIETHNHSSNHRDRKTWIKPELYDALHSDSIPVLAIDSKCLLPFQQLIDYDSFIIFLPSEAFRGNSLLKELRSINMNRRETMVEAMQRSRHLLKYRLTPDLRPLLFSGDSSGLFSSSVGDGFVASLALLRNEIFSLDE